MIKLIRHYDVNGDLIQEDDDRALKDRVLKPGESLRIPLQWMDGKSGPPAGYYVLRDGAGRPCGLGRVDLAEKAAAAREDYAQRLANAHKKLVPMTDAAVPNGTESVPNGTTKAERRAQREDAVPADASASQLAYAAYVRRLAGAHKHA